MDPAFDSSSIDPCNLIVNYLPSALSEDELRSLFSSCGSVESCKIVCDKVTGQSKGFGFVKFVSEDCAQKAIQQLNGFHIRGKTLKVSVARPASDELRYANLYVSRIPFTTTQGELEQLFSQFGTLISCKLLIDTATQSSRGVAFIRFSKRSEAQQAYQALHNSVLPGANTALLIKFADNSNYLQKRFPIQPEIMPDVMMNQPTYNVYYSALPMLSQQLQSVSKSPVVVTGIPSNAALQTMNSVTSPVGLQLSTSSASASSTPAMSPVSDSRGLFNNNSPNTHTPVPSMAMMSPYMPPPANGSQPGWCLFVYNLPSTADEFLLYQLFGPCGAVLKATIVRDTRTGKSKNYGFVNMLNFEEAHAAILRLHGANIGDRRLHVSFKTPASRIPGQ